MRMKLVWNLIYNNKFCVLPSPSPSTKPQFVSQTVKVMYGIHILYIARSHIIYIARLFGVFTIACAASTTITEWSMLQIFNKKHTLCSHILQSGGQLGKKNRTTEPHLYVLRRFHLARISMVFWKTAHTHCYQITVFIVHGCILADKFWLVSTIGAHTHTHTSDRNSIATTVVEECYLVALIIWLQVCVCR